jgi:hypothetical protein
LTHLVNNVIGTTISTRPHDKHQLEFVRALKGELFKTIKTRSEQWESELNPHRIDDYTNTKKYLILYRLCKSAVKLLERQLTKANQEPLENFHHGLTVFARVYIDYYNELVSYNADLIQADLTYTRDKEGFKETSETNKGIYIKIGALGTELVPPEPEGPPPKETLLEVIVEGLALGSGEELLHLVDREITEVERHFVSPVGQFNGSYLQLA